MFPTVSRHNMTHSSCPKTETMKRILITGAGGFLGGYFLRRLAREDNVFIIAVDRKEGSDWFVNPRTITRGTNTRVKTLARYNLGVSPLNWISELQPEIIYHFAAEMGGIGYIKDHDFECAASISATVAVTKLCQQISVEKVFYASTACVYRTGLQDVQGAVPLREDMACPGMAEGGYGEQKLFGEALFGYVLNQRSKGRSPLHVRIGRFFNVYGPDSDYSNDRAKAPMALAYRFLSTLRATETPITAAKPLCIPVWGDGRQERSFLHVADAFHAVQLLMAYEDPETQGFSLITTNIGNPDTITIRRYVEYVAEALGVEHFELVPQTTRHTGVRSRTADIGRISDLVGWMPEITYARGVKDILDWLRQRGV